VCSAILFIVPCICTLLTPTDTGAGLGAGSTAIVVVILLIAVLVVVIVIVGVIWWRKRSGEGVLYYACTNGHRSLFRLAVSLESIT